jgi:hypothetical protein
VKYLVLWKGYPREQATWEPGMFQRNMKKILINIENHLSSCQMLIDEFKTTRQQALVADKNESDTTKFEHSNVQRNLHLVDENQNCENSKFEYVSALKS